MHKKGSSGPPLYSRGLRLPDTPWKAAALQVGRLCSGATSRRERLGFLYSPGGCRIPGGPRRVVWAHNRRRGIITLPPSHSISGSALLVSRFPGEGLSFVSPLSPASGIGFRSTGVVVRHSTSVQMRNCVYTILYQLPPSLTLSHSRGSLLVPLTHLKAMIDKPPSPPQARSPYRALFAELLFEFPSK